MPIRQNILPFVFCICLAGQPAPGVVRNLAVTVSGEGDEPTIRIRNEYSAPATAWIVQCGAPQGPSRHYWNDQELSFQSAPLAPGKETEFKFRQTPAMGRQAADNGPCPDFRVAAAVFADGTVSGDLAWIDAIVADRRQAYQDIGKVTEMLNTAISKGADTPEVIQQLTELEKTVMPPGMPVRPSATSGVSWGSHSRGSAPPRMRVFRSPVPGAALWLVSTQAMKLPDAVKALTDWRGRLAK